MHLSSNCSQISQLTYLPTDPGKMVTEQAEVKLTHLSSNCPWSSQSTYLSTDLVRIVTEQTEVKLTHLSSNCSQISQLTYLSIDPVRVVTEQVEGQVDQLVDIPYPASWYPLHKLTHKLTSGVQATERSLPQTEHVMSDCCQHVMVQTV